jgi:uncharacterized protein (DUF885 family)
MKIYDDYFHETMLLNPSSNDSLNLSKYKYLKNRMENSFDKDHIEKNKKLHLKYLEKIKKKNKLNIFDKTLIYSCENYLEYFKYNLELIPINHQENIITYILENAGGDFCYSYKIKKDYDDFLIKMENFESIVNCIIENMKIGIKKKVVLPKVLTEKLMEQLESCIKTKPYYNKKITITLNYNYNKKLDNIFVGPITNLIKFLKTVYLKNSSNKIGLCHLPNGINMYKYLVRSSLTIKNINIDKMHKFGLDEVKNIHKKMIDLKNKLKFKGSLPEFNKYLKNKKSLQFKNSNELLTLYRNEIKKIDETIIPQYFNSNVNIKNKCLVEPVPKYNEDFSAEAYYMHGDLENTRNGKFYINLKNIKDNSKIEIESLTLHEVNPGHHFQITYHNESNLPLFIKTFNNDCYCEGWALYCENLGTYTDLESFYGKLIMEMIRALRIVVDSGIHYYGWTYKKAFDYYKKYSFDSDPQIHNQILRYIAIPTQALTYKMGEKFIFDLGADFKGNVKDFHSKFLQYGPVPLFLLKEEFK